MRTRFEPAASPGANQVGTRSEPVHRFFLALAFSCCSKVLRGATGSEPGRIRSPRAGRDLALLGAHQLRTSSEPVRYSRLGLVRFDASRVLRGATGSAPGQIRSPRAGRDLALLGAHRFRSGCATVHAPAWDWGDLAPPGCLAVLPGQIRSPRAGRDLALPGANRFRSGPEHTIFPVLSHRPKSSEIGPFSIGFGTVFWLHRPVVLFTIGRSLS